MFTRYTKPRGPDRPTIVECTKCKRTLTRLEPGFVPCGLNDEGAVTLQVRCKCGERRVGAKPASD